MVRTIGATFRDTKRSATVRWPFAGKGRGRKIDRDTLVKAKELAQACKHMAVDIIRYVDGESEEILEAVVSSIVPRAGEMVTIGDTTYQAGETSYVVSQRLDDFLDRDDKVHIAVVTLEAVELEDSVP
jgi:hypothetical protein